MPRVGVGKVDDLFAGRDITSIHTPTNADAYALIEGALLAMRRGLLLANVIEFDQTWGHRNDVPGFHARAAGAGPRGCPGCWPGCARRTSLSLPPITATTRPPRPPITRARSCRCWWWARGSGRCRIGRRRTFADVGQTVAEFLGVPALPAGVSFLHEVWSE